MAKVKLSIGSAKKAFVWDRSSFPFMQVRKASDDTPWFRVGAFLRINTDGDVDAGTVDGDEDDVVDLTNGFRLANNVPIKWKTVAGANRTMLKLTDGDIFNIGNNDADGANEIRFDVEGVANIFKITPIGLIGNSYPYYADGAAGTDRDFIWSTSGVKRWRTRGGSAPESGANAGTNWHLDAFNDAGTLIDSPIDLVRAAGGAMSLSRQLVGPASWNIGVTGDTDLLLLAANLLTLNGDLVGDSSFNIGPSTDPNLLVLSSDLVTVGGDIVGGSGAFTLTQISGSVGGLAFATSKNVGTLSIAGQTSARMVWNHIGGTANQRIFQIQCDSPSVLFVKRTDVGSSTTLLTLDLNTGNATFAFDVAVNGGDFTSTAGSFNFLTANVTTFTALQAMTLGSIGATTGQTRFRHDLYVGDGSGAQFIELDGGAANRDLIWSNNASDRWRMRVDSSEDWRFYRSADGSTFYQAIFIDNTDGYGYLGTDPRWAWDTNGRLKNKTLDHDVTCYFFEDFTYHNDASPAWPKWEQDDGGGGISIVDERGGVVRLESGSPGGSYYALFGGGGAIDDTNPVAYNGYPVIFECRVKNGAAATNGTLTIGLRGGAYFFKDSSNSGNWICMSKNAFLGNSTNTSVSSTAYHLLRIEIESSSSLKFYIDDVLVATHTANLPTSNMCIYMDAGYLVGNSTAGDLYADYVKATWARA